MTMNANTEKYLIVNADDLGFSEKVNEGITEAHINGIVTSTSMMMTMPAVDHALNELQKCPELDVGLHVDLSWGKPLSEPSTIPSLVTSNGNFVGKKGLFIRLLFNCIPRKELEIEILAQVKSFKQLGLNLYHADVHQHFHCFLVVMKALMNVAIIENIPYIRLPSELSFSSLTNTFLTLMFLNSKKKWQPFIGSSNYFLGLSLTGKINEERLLQSLNQLKSGITELMCHPGYIDDSIKNISRLNKREQELNTLKSSGVKDYIKEKKIVLTTYRNLMLKN